MSAHGHGEAESHRSSAYYLGIAVVLASITLFELGPLFKLYHLPPLLLIALSATKFFIVVAFFMHLWDDNPMFTRLFAAPLIGASLMIVVFMALNHTFAPAPANEVDTFPVQERYWAIFNGKCSSWLRSNKSNRWYCASGATAGPIDSVKVQEHLALLSGGAAAANDPACSADVAGMSADAQHEWLLKNGKDMYDTVCVTCHKDNGEGVPGNFPPLKGSVSFYGDAQHHANIIVNGLSGPITVNGANFGSQQMPSHAAYCDNKIAAVASFERNSWGNNDGFVMPADVKAVRQK